MGYFQSLADIVAVLYKRLLRQVGVESLNISLALSTAINYYTICAASLGYRHAFANRIDKSIFGEWFYDA